MLEIRISTRGLDEMAAALKNTARMLRSFKRDWLMMLGNRMVEEHQDAFKYGGHKDGPQWEPTDPFWVKHMKDKAGKGPMNWTGTAMNTLASSYFGNHVFLKAVDYIGEFQFGPLTKRETFGVTTEGDDWVKVPNDGDSQMTRTIKRHAREVFWLGDDMNDYFVDELNGIERDIFAGWANA